MKSKSLIPFYLLAALVLLGCNLSTILPSATPTQPPIAMPSGPCSADDVLVTLRNYQPLKQVIPEYSVNYSFTMGISYLNIWFVALPLTAGVNGQDFDLLKWTAIVDAAVISMYAVAAAPCITSVFDSINPVVVDREYNGWFSGSIPVSKVPASFYPSSQEVESLARDFDIVYTRQSLPPSADIPPAGTCTWQEANRMMHLHFAPSRQNVDFYFVADEISRKVTAQWDGAASTLTDIGVIYASIMNVTQEAQCLFPVPDYLYFMVLDPNGSLVWWARLPSSGIQPMDLNQLEILYQSIRQTG